MEQELENEVEHDPPFKEKKIGESRSNVRWDERRGYKTRERARFRGGIKDRWEVEQVKPNEFKQIQTY